MPVIGFVDLDRRFRDRTDAELEHSELEDAETFASLDGQTGAGGRGRSARRRATLGGSGVA